MTVRLLHTADWQLGKPFSKIPGDPGALLREARFMAVRRIAALAREHEADAVLVAGDAFDCPHPDRRTVRQALAAMAEFPGQWLLLPGNHDAALAECVWTAIARDGCPANLRLVLTPEPIPLADDRAMVLPAPLRARRTPDDLTEGMDACGTPEGAIRVGLAHGSVAERLPQGAIVSNPVAADRAARAGLAYLALGDWHGLQQICPRTWYSGTPEPDDFPAQAQPGRAILVELDGPGAAARTTALTTATYTWAALDLDAAALGEIDVAAALAAQLASLAERQRLILRLRLHGTVALGQRAEFERALERLSDEVHHLALDTSDLVDAPCPADLALLEAEPVVGRAAARLRALGEAAEPDRAAAAMALRLLYSAARELS